MSGLLAFCGLAFVASITPGPTNLILLTQGMNFGVRASQGFIIGASAGAAGILWLASQLSGLVAFLPQAAPVLSYLAAIWLTWLAWQLASSRSDGGASNQHRLGWRSGALMQFINPKTWGMAFAVAGLYGIGTDWQGVSVLALLFFLITVPCLLCWAALGRWMLVLQRWQGIVNPLLGGLLLVAAWWPVLQAP